MKDDILQNIANWLNTSTYVAGGGTVLFGLNAAEWGILGVLIGIVTTLGMAGFTIWFKMKYQRENNVS